MSTNSTITVRTKKNERKQVYCHWDGYLEGVGKTLLEHYNTKELAIKLVEHGDISSLDVKSEPTTNYHTFESPEGGTTVYYGRDRGETNIEPKILKNSESGNSEQFNYYYDGENWFVDYDSNGKKLLKIAMMFNNYK